MRPQIGTVFEAYKRERQSLNMYKFEKLNDEWKRLVDSVNFPEISNDFSQGLSLILNFNYSILTPFFTEKFPHVSSNDNSKMKSSAKAFLSENANRQFSNESFIGKHYLRAICRMYLVDFICLNYKLPIECDDITNEIKL